MTDFSQTTLNLYEQIFYLTLPKLINRLLDSLNIKLRKINKPQLMIELKRCQWSAINYSDPFGSDINM